MQIEDLESGMRINSITLLLNKVVEKKKKSGGNFYILHFSDSTGSIEGRIWDQDSVDVQDNTLVRVAGDIVEYRNSPQLKVRKIKEKDNQSKISNYIDNSHGDPFVYFEKFLTYVDNYCSTEGKLSISHFFGVDFVTESDCRVYNVVDRVKYENVCGWPAARNNHHACYGGLIQHIYSMASIVVQSAKHYNNLYDEEIFDVGKLVVAVALHDLGKLKEISGPFDKSYTKLGHTTGHISIMLEDFHEFKMNEPRISDQFYKEIKHMISSHHGKKEWGSPVEPATPEAKLLHRADMMDSRMARLCEDYLESDDDEFWSGDGRVYKEL